MLGVHNVAVDVAAFCKAAGKPFILFAASDINFSDEYRSDLRKKNTTGVPAFVLHHTITNADLIITQTEAQAILSRENFQRSSITINNPIDLTNLDQMQPQVPEQ